MKVLNGVNKINGWVILVYLMGKVTILLSGRSGRARRKGPLWDVGKMLTVLL